MSTPIFNGQITLNNSGQINDTDFDLEFSFIDYEGVWGGTDLQIGDQVYLDTSGLIPGTVSRYAVISINPLTTFSNVLCTVRFNDNTSVIDPAYAIGISSFASRPTPLLTFNTVASPGVQQLPDKFSWYPTNSNVEEYDSAAGANNTLSNLVAPTAINQDLIFTKVPAASSIIQTGNTSGVSSQDLTLASGNMTTGDKSGDVFIRTGAATSASVGSGDINLLTGSVSTSLPTGKITLATSNSTLGNTGQVSISSGDTSGPGKVAGGVSLFGGNITGSSGTAGQASLLGGSVTGTGGNAGNAIVSGGSNSTTGFSGNVSILGGNNTGNGIPGNVAISAGSGAVSNGTVTIAGGTSTAAAGGAVTFSAGNSTGADGGTATLTGGTRTLGGTFNPASFQAFGGISGQGGSAAISGGNASTGVGGAIFLHGGYGVGVGAAGGFVQIAGGTSNGAPNGALVQIISGLNDANFNTGELQLLTSNALGSGNSGQLLIKTGTVATGIRGKVLIDAANLDVNSAPIINVLDPVNPQDAATKSYVDSIGTPTVYLILNNQASPVDIFSVPTAQYVAVFIDYSVLRNSIVEVGNMTISNDGSVVPGFATVGSSTGITGVTFNATNSGGDLKLQYTSDNTSTGTMKYTIRGWA